MDALPFTESDTDYHQQFAAGQMFPSQQQLGSAAGQMFPAQQQQLGTAAGQMFPAQQQQLDNAAAVNQKLSSMMR